MRFPGERTPDVETGALTRDGSLGNYNITFSRNYRLPLLQKILRVSGAESR